MTRTDRIHGQRSHPDPRNLERLRVCLADIEAVPALPSGEAGARPADGPVAHELSGTYETAIGVLDVVATPIGPAGPEDRLDFATLNARATTRILAGQAIRVAHVDDLLASRRRSSRPKDRATVEALLEAVGKEPDTAPET